MPKANPDWSDKELIAAVAAYLQMLSYEKEGKPFTKSEFNRTLREEGGPLAGRTKASVEYRMQNISAVLVDEGLDYLKGYRPASNVGPGIRKRILNILRSSKLLS